MRCTKAGCAHGNILFLSMYQSTIHVVSRRDKGYFWMRYLLVSTFSGRTQGNYKSRASALVFLMIWTMHVYFKVFCHCTDCSSSKSSYFKKRGCVVGIQVQRNLRLVSFSLYVPGLQVPGIPTKRCGVGSFKRLTGPSEGSICQRLPNQKALRDDRSEYRNIERRKQNIGYLPATKTIELCYILVISNPQLL